MNNLDKQYIETVNKIVDCGTVSGDRTGTGTIKHFGFMIDHDMSEGLPVITSKKMFTKGVILELLWFLSGETNIKPLVDNGVNIWVGDCYKRYVTKFNKSKKQGLFVNDTDAPISQLDFLNYIKDHHITDPFVKEYADIGKSYGYQWRQLKGADQIKNLLTTLKEDPNSRRMIVDSWNPQHLKDMLLTPCHFAFQVVTRELSHEEKIQWVLDGKTPKPVDLENLYITEAAYDPTQTPQYEISLMFHLRSSDTILGLPFNILSYGLLLEMIAQQVNMKPGRLIGTLGDAHVYLDQYEIYNEKQRNAPTFKLPKLELNKAKDLFSYTLEDFKIIGYQSSPKIEYPLSN